MGIFDKAKDALSKNSDKVDQAIDKAGDLIDQKTGNQHAANVDKGQAMAKEKLAEFVGGGDQQDAAEAGQAPVPPVPGSAAPVTPPTTPSANTPPPATPPV